jgi:MFS family permease
VSGVRSRTLAPVYLTHAMVHLAVGLFPAVLVVLHTQFDASYALLGGVFSAAMLVYGFGALPVGLLLDRVSPLLLVRLSLGGITLALVAIALSPDKIWFAAGLLLLGFACAPYHTAALTLVSRVSGNDPRLIGHHGMWGNIGLAGAPTFGALLAWAVSWRLPFACAAGLGALLLVPLCTRLPAMAAGSRTTERPAATGERDSTDRAALALVLAITACLGFVYRGFATFLPALTAQRADLIPASALVAGGLLASLVYVTGFFGQWWGGHLGGRRRAAWAYAGLLATAAALLAAAFFATDVALIVLLAAFSFTHFSPTDGQHVHRPIHFAAPARDRLRPELRALVRGRLAGRLAVRPGGRCGRWETPVRTAAALGSSLAGGGAGGRSRAPDEASRGPAGRASRFARRVGRPQRMSAAMIAFWTCRRFSAWSKAIDWSQ